MNNLITNINRTSIFPPSLSIEEAINLLNSNRSLQNCHGQMLCKILVAKECRRLGENNKMKIASAASYLWKESTSQEKSDYIDLSIRSFYS
ncbi:6705_t:CDS:2 [Diversispora eburnea]|uniref:6705_t:CDS:1 n=1 Tax=Diversispora eburnea TaxID=1213867 RepID=A0A9N8ZT70_9GLOM|nr:6705_t:CDS:2 [Diversispora eburnea]